MGFFSKGEKKEKKKLIFNIPVKILKKRGKSISVEITAGREIRTNKESEVPRMKLQNGKELDFLDYSKMDESGSITLLEKPDGQLIYADLKDNEIIGTGEGVLRDGYYLNQNWIDTSFPIKADKWKTWVPIIVIAVAVLGIGISTWLTYNYWKTLNEDKSQIVSDTLNTIKQVAQTNDKIARSLEIATGNMAQITSDMSNIQSNTNKAGGVTQ